MSIWVDKKTSVIVQGITGTSGKFHAEQMVADGTRVIAGVTPGKGGEKIAGIPVFNTIAEVLQANPTAAADSSKVWSIGFVPAAHAKVAGIEAIEAGINSVVISEHVPVHDTLALLAAARAKRVRFIGPNCPGIITPGQTKIGIMPASFFKPGPIGLVSRSGTLTYEIVSRLSAAGIGQSTCVGIGGDPVNLTSLNEVLEAFEQDPDTQAIVIIGEIGGRTEEHAAETVLKKMSKPVVAFLAGRAAPLGKTLGHAGAIIEGKTGTVASKERALKKAGAQVAVNLADVVPLVQAALKEQR
jgi:succinyl-CoA synthetase alpha subunit